jgi:hypothetical protein
VSKFIFGVATSCSVSQEKPNKLKLILEPILEADFQPGSFGYRPKRAASGAIQRVAEAILTNRTYWLTHVYPLCRVRTDPQGWINRHGGQMAEKRETNPLTEIEESRREFMKAAGKLAVYTAPAMLVLMKPSREAIAKSGCNNGVGNSTDCLPPGLENNGKGGFLDNDDNSGTPGNPQNQGGNN